MTCTEARDRMLEAERPELEARGGSDLAHHIRQCAGCQAVAARVVREEEALGAALASLPATPVEEALSRLREARPHVGSPRSGPPRRREARHSTSRAGAWWSVAATAAAAVVLLALALSDLPNRSGSPSTVSAPSAATAPSATAPSRDLPRPASGSAAHAPVVEAGDREVAVFTTSNPNIIVAWIYQEPIE